MEDVGIFYGHLVSFMDIWSILWTFGLHILWTFGLIYGHLVYFMGIWSILLTYCIFCGNLVQFSRFGMMYQEESGNPGCPALSKKLVKLSVGRAVWAWFLSTCDMVGQRKKIFNDKY
jgi:hypothetical protein